MAPSRRKAPKQIAPQTIEEATDHLARYMELQGQIEVIRADADEAIIAIQGARDGFAAPLDEECKTIFRELRAWWAVASPELTEGKTKSIKLAGALIGERTTTPSLKLEGIKAEALIEQLFEIGANDELVRVKLELDKPACIRAIGVGDELGQLLRWLGASTAQKEEFFIDRSGKKAADPEEIEVPEVAL